MDYTEFCYRDEHTTTLTRREIESPFLLIDELCKKRTEDEFLSAIRVLQNTIYKYDEWMKHNPLDLYTTYEDTMRLVDALFLINEYTPKVSTILKIYSPEPRLMGEITKLVKKGTASKSDKQENRPITVLENIYAEQYLSHFKMDTYSCLEIGLNVSYMENNKYDYFGGCENNYALLFSNLEVLITEAYQIHRKHPSIFPILTIPKEIKFSIDSERPTHLSESYLKNPRHFFFDLYTYYLNHNNTHTGMSAWKALIFENQAWEKESNPGNLLYLNETLIQLIDIIWLLNQNDQLQNLNDNYKAKKQYKKLITSCNELEFKNPILAIETFMGYKKMHEWKTTLIQWLKYSLSNDSSPSIGIRAQINTEFTLLEKLIEAVLLLSYPTIQKFIKQPHL